MIRRRKNGLDELYSVYLSCCSHGDDAHSYGKQIAEGCHFNSYGNVFMPFVSELNGLLLRLTDSTILYFTTNVTPITEELVKVLPVIYYAYVFSDDRNP